MFVPSWVIENNIFISDFPICFGKSFHEAIFLIMVIWKYNIHDARDVTFLIHGIRCDQGTKLLNLHISQCWYISWNADIPSVDISRPGKSGNSLSKTSKVNRKTSSIYSGIYKNVINIFLFYSKQSLINITARKFNHHQENLNHWQ